MSLIMNDGRSEAEDHDMKYFYDFSDSQEVAIGGYESFQEIDVPLFHDSHLLESHHVNISKESLNAGLLFSVEHFYIYLCRNKVEEKSVSMGAAIFVTAVLEYLALEILELAHSMHGVPHSSPSFIIDGETVMLAVKRDQELSNIFMELFTSTSAQQTEEANSTVDNDLFPSSILHLLLKQLGCNYALSPAAIKLIQRMLRHLLDLLEETTSQHHTIISCLVVEESIIKCLPVSLSGFAVQNGRQSVKRWVEKKKRLQTTETNSCSNTLRNCLLGMALLIGLPLLLGSFMDWILVART